MPSECDGFARDSPKVADRVQFLARALLSSLNPRECVGRTAVFEAARPGPIPGRGAGRKHLWSSECAGFARDPAKVEDQVQFLARAFPTWSLVRDSGFAPLCGNTLLA